MRKIVAILALVMGLVLGGGLFAAANSWMVGSQSGSDVEVSGCVLRFPDGYPEIYANGAHMCAGVTGVSVNQHGEVLVSQSYKNPGNEPILFAMCQADETLGGQRGIICGASGGTNSTRYRLYDSELERQLNLNNQSDRNRIAGETANLWVGWIHGDW